MSRAVSAVSRKWVARVLSALAVWATVVTAARALGNQPRVGLLALVVAALATVLWVFIDASTQVDPMVWDRSSDERIRPPGEDPRLALLGRVVAHHLDGRQSSGALRRHLLELADHRLMSRYGLSRRADEERAAAVLGPELTALAEQQEPFPKMTLDEIDVLLRRIEAL